MTQKKVEIYHGANCPYCTRAMGLLDRKKVSYVDYNITNDDEGRQKMMERTGGFRSIPQIFIDDKHIGGCDDLYALESKGELDQLLNG